MLPTLPPTAARPPANAFSFTSLYLTQLIRALTLNFQPCHDTALYDAGTEVILSSGKRAGLRKLHCFGPPPGKQ